MMMITPIFSKTPLRKIALIIALAGINGCAEMKVRRFQVDVDSISTPAANEKKRYLLLPGDKNIPHEDLQFHEFTRYIEKAMGEKGFVRVNSPEESEVIVFLTYGIGNAEKHLSSYTIPHFGQTGVSASQTTGTLSNFGGMSSFSALTTYTPTFGVTGYSSGVKEYVTYPRFIILDAFDSEANHKENIFKPVWRTRADSVGYSNDLRLVFPYMVVSMKSHFATNSGKKIVYQISENDSSVKALIGN